MKGCLAVIGGAVVVFFIFALMVGGNLASSMNPASHERTSASGSSSDAACSTADTRERQAADYLDNHQYQRTYDTVVSGLHYVSLCSSDDDNLVNKGYLLSFKAYAEHYLSSGDSKTDMNEANQLLVECQTHPGFYGTHIGAQCETQENNNIRTTTNWEMESY